MIEYPVCSKQRGHLHKIKFDCQVQRKRNITQLNIYWYVYIEGDRMFKRGYRPQVRLWRSLVPSSPAGYRWQVRYVKQGRSMLIDFSQLCGVASLLGYIFNFCLVVSVLLVSGVNLESADAQEIGITYEMMQVCDTKVFLSICCATMWNHVLPVLLRLKDKCPFPLLQFWSRSFCSLVKLEATTLAYANGKSFQ